MFPMQGSKVRLDAVILIKLGFHVVVDVLDLLEAGDRAVRFRIKKKKRKKVYLDHLKRCDL